MSHIHTLLPRAFPPTLHKQSYWKDEAPKSLGLLQLQSFIHLDLTCKNPGSWVWKKCLRAIKPHHIPFSYCFHVFRGALFKWHPTSGLLKALNESSAAPTHLFVPLGSLHPHTKGLSALVALWTGQAVETWIGVDAALSSTYFVANIRHHVTLRKEKRASAKFKEIHE